ncbi:MAG: hypothetical protein P8R42_05695 [Candidatus Binatia bacterium]|nr:hypothetical protein [Candidatus Binatia bacterium]
MLFTFPNADTCNVLRKTWRWDNPITPHREGCAAVWMFSFLAPMRPGGGVTVIVEGTHRE